MYLNQEVRSIVPNSKIMYFSVTWPLQILYYLRVAKRPPYKEDDIAIYHGTIFDIKLSCYNPHTPSPREGVVKNVQKTMQDSLNWCGVPTENSRKVCMLVRLMVLHFCSVPCNHYCTCGRKQNINKSMCYKYILELLKEIVMLSSNSKAIEPLNKIS